MPTQGTFEADITHFDPNNPYVGDEKTPVQFYMGVTPDQEQTKLQGRPIFRDEEYIRILNSKDNIIDRPIRITDKQRWPRAYQAWKSTGESEPGNIGTRLEHWPQMSRAQAEEYRYFKIYTVEQLATLPDTQCQKIMGAVKLRQLAQAYVDAAKGGVPLIKMQEELAKRDGTIAELMSEVRRLTKLVEKKVEA